MTRLIRAAALVVISGCATPGAQPSAPAALTTAIVNANVVDVARGVVLRDRVVLIAGERIVDVRSRVPRDAQIIDARGAYVIPGLWDMHTHGLASFEARAPIFVANGITGVRELGAASLEALRETRAFIARSSAPMPRLIASAVLIDGSPPVRPAPRSVVLNRAEDAPRLVDSLVAGGADFLKVYSRIKREPFYALMAEARRRNIAVAGHLPTAFTPEEISDAGMRSIEHIFFFANACSARAAQLRAAMSPLEGSPELPALRMATADTVVRTYDRDKCSRIHAHLARNGTFVTPTLYIWKRGGPQLEANARDSSVARYFPEGLTRVVEPIVPEYRVSRALSEARYALMSTITADMHRAGVKLLVGTDTNAPWMWPGFSLHDEMRTLVEDAGMSAADVLRAATLNAASYFAATDSMGTVAPGKVADLVLLAANPLADIRHTERITGVFLRGRYLDRSALDALLGQPRQE